MTFVNNSGKVPYIMVAGCRSCVRRNAYCSCGADLQRGQEESQQPVSRLSGLRGREVFFCYGEDLFPEEKGPMTNKVWLIFLAIFLLLLSSCASEPVPNEQEHPTQTEPIDQIESPSPSLSHRGQRKRSLSSLRWCGERRGAFPLIQRKRPVCGVC